MNYVRRKAVNSIEHTRTKGRILPKGLAMGRKAFLARIIRQSKENGEKIPHPVRVAVSPEKQWDGKWFDVTLTSDGETISVASFRRIEDARAYRKRIVEALKIPDLDAQARGRRALRKRQVMAMERKSTKARRSPRH